MSFRMKSKNYFSKPETREQLEANKITDNTTKLHVYKDKYIYVPNKEEKNEFIPRSANEYTRHNKPQVLFDNSIYEKEEIVYDKHADKWILAKESEMYKYNFDI